MAAVRVWRAVVNNTASCLAKLLQKKSRKDPELRHIKCDYVVGHTEGAAFQKKDTKMK